MRSFAPYLFAAALVCALLIAMPLSLRERMMLFVAPSAERAYRYGLAHISSAGDAHSLADAAYFFKRAAEIDSGYPYVHHQLARIAFLNADYHAALAEVDIEISNDPQKTRASPFYLRGLIEGYLNDYDAAVRDYKQFVELSPERWEGRTDYAWVLIKTHNFKEALAVVDEGLVQFPGNPWLMSMRATILFESGRLDEALPVARAAVDAFDRVDEAAWLQAYPGNSPDAAKTGIETLRSAARDNVKKIEAAGAR